MNDVLKNIFPVNTDDSINVFVEIEKGGKNKYELDKSSGLIKLDRVLPTAQVYPFDYGLVLNTLWKDGDPLDVVLLTSYPILPGVLVEARVVACLDMIDNGESDAKIIAVPKYDPRFTNIQDLGDINPHSLEEITHFFKTYKILEGKEVTIPNIYAREKALEIVKESLELFKNKK